MVKIVGDGIACPSRNRIEIFMIKKSIPLLHSCHALVKIETDFENLVLVW